MSQVKTKADADDAIMAQVHIKVDEWKVGRVRLFKSSADEMIYLVGQFITHTLATYSEDNNMSRHAGRVPRA